MGNCGCARCLRTYSRREYLYKYQKFLPTVVARYFVFFFLFFFKKRQIPSGAFHNSKPSAAGLQYRSSKLQKCLQLHISLPFIVALLEYVNCKWRQCSRITCCARRYYECSMQCGGADICNIHVSFIRKFSWTLQLESALSHPRDYFIHRPR